MSLPHRFLSPFGTPLPQRPAGEIVVTFFLIPMLLGSGLAALMALTLVQNSGMFGWWGWLAAAWALVLTTVLMIAVPAVGGQELWRRRRSASNARRMSSGTKM